MSERAAQAALQEALRAVEGVHATGPAPRKTLALLAALADALTSSTWAVHPSASQEMAGHRWVYDGVSIVRVDHLPQGVFRWRHLECLAAMVAAFPARIVPLAPMMGWQSGLFRVVRLYRPDGDGVLLDPNYLLGLPDTAEFWGGSDVPDPVEIRIGGKPVRYVAPIRGGWTPPETPAAGSETEAPPRATAAAHDGRSGEGCPGAAGRGDA